MKNNFREGLLKNSFYHDIVCFVYLLECPHLGDSNDYTHYTICIEDGKDFPKESPYTS